MSKLPEIEEARLNLTYISGQLQGTEVSVKWLREKSGEYFMRGNDSAATLLRQLSGSLGQDVEVLKVSHAKAKKHLDSLEQL